MVDKITSPIGANELIIKVNDVIDAIPTAVSQLDNDSGFITGITSSDVTTALGFTPYNSSNPDGYITSAAISSLTDVSLTNLSNGEGLIYNSTSGKWENTTISGGGGTASWGRIYFIRPGRLKHSIRREASNYNRCCFFYYFK